VLEAEAERMQIADGIEDEPQPPPPSPVNITPAFKVKNGSVNKKPLVTSKGKNELNKVAELLKGVILRKNREKDTPTINENRRKVRSLCGRQTKTTANAQ
jgi:hypothetical protein